MKLDFSDLLSHEVLKTPDDEVMSFNEYMQMVLHEPWVTRNPSQLLHDMVLASGVEHSILAGKPIKHRYRFFEDGDRVGPYVVFGQQKAKENLF